MKKAPKLAKRPHCVDFHVFDNQVAQPKKQIEAAVAEHQQRQKALIRIKMRMLNYFISKPFVNYFCVL